MEEKQRNKSRIEKNPRWHCSVCDIFTNSYKQFNAHLEGVGHHHKMKRIGKHGAEKTCNISQQREDHDCDLGFYVLAFIQVIIISFVLFYVLIKFCN